MYSVILIYEICYCDKKTLNLRRYSMYNVAFNKKMLYVYTRKR